MLRNLELILRVLFEVGKSDIKGKVDSFERQCGHQHGLLVLVLTPCVDEISASALSYTPLGEMIKKMINDEEIVLFS